LSNINLKFSKIYGVKNISASIDHTFLPLYPAKRTIKSLIFYYDYNQIVENDLPFQNIDWERIAINKAGIKYTYLTRLNHTISFTISGDLTLANSNYTQIKAEYLQSFRSLPIAIRAFCGFSSHLPALQDRFYISSANPSEQMRNPLFRSLYFLNGNMSKDAKLNLAGGGNITSLLENLNSGKNIVAFSIESHPLFNAYLKSENIYLLELKAFLYSNIANLWDDGYNNFSDFMKGTLIEGGLALSLDMFPGGSMYAALLPNLSNTSIRFNIPFILNKTKNDEPYLDWRWNISIGKVINI
jgi:hypothetical protein